MRHEPKVSSCCGFEGTGEMIDMGLCGDCKDQCTYEDYFDDDEEENSMMMSAFTRSEEIDEDFDDPVWDASDFVKDENDLP